MMRVGLPLLVGLSLVVSCGSTPPTPPNAATPRPPPRTAASTGSASPVSATAAPPIVAPAPRPPPPVVTTPMAGEPDPSALKEARLVETSCKDLPQAAARVAKLRIQEMRKELEQSYETWRESQPQCWDMWGDQLSESGSNYGFGAGHGRLSGSHATSGVRAGGGGLSGLSGTGRSAQPPPAAPREATSRSGTNNQVASVDEADFVKTDGRYLYLAMNGALRIVEALNPRAVSVTKLEGTVRDLFIEGDRAVVYTSHGSANGKRCTYGYDCEFTGDGSSTKILVFDVTNRTAPKLVREVALSGSLLTARRIGRTVHTVVSDGDGTPPLPSWPPGMDTCGVTEARVRQRFAELRRDNERKILASVSFPVIRELGRERTLCDNLLRAPLADGDAFTTLVSFDLAHDRQPSATSTIQSRPGAVFASADALYLSVVHRRDANGTRGPGRWYSFHARSNEVSDVHKFAIGSEPGSTRYVGSGVVPGRVLNQFSMDEYYGYLRIATTRGRVPDPKVESAVSILRESATGALVRVGAVEHIAPGEDIRSVRFDEDRGYVVTFKKTDPLFVLELHDPAAPRILGELKIPGFSSYIHRLDATHLLSIGFDGDDRASFAYFDGVLLQIFDVANPADPKLVHREEIGTRGSSSEAATDHLAFNYFPEKGLLAIPATVCEGGGNGRFGSEMTFSGLLLYRVSTTDGFSRLGGVDHGKEGVHCHNWWSRATSLVKRSVFLDDLVVSIAERRLKAQKLGNLGTDVADVALAP
jgi:hypothetical protein